MFNFNAFIKYIFSQPFTYLTIMFFIVASWPFIGFPLTDGDIGNWIHWPYAISQGGSFFTTESVLSHGPLLAWGTAFFMKILPINFYTINLFNLLCGIGSISLIYLLFKQNNQPKLTKQLVGIFGFSTLAIVYLSRTPLFDLPATFGYLFFCYNYAIYRQKNDRKWLWLAYIGLIIGISGRLTIVLGLSGIFMLMMEYSFQPSFRKYLQTIIKQGLMMLLVTAIVYIPWVFLQYQQGAEHFITEFIYDNIFRYFGDEKGHSSDYYSFTISALVALIPITPLLLAGITKSFVKHCKKETLPQILLASSIPCLILFSFSGHTKIPRYIAYIFPSLIGLTAYIYALYHKDPSYIKRCKYIYYAFLGFIGLLLSYYALQFKTEVQESTLLVYAAILLVIGLIVTGLGFTCFKSNSFYQNPWPYFIICSVFYLLFLTQLSIDYSKISYLTHIKTKIESRLQ